MHLAVDRYLRGSLSDEETAEFEERLVWDQALLDEIDLAEQLRAGLQSALSKNEEAKAPAEASLFDRFAALFQMPVYAAAASFALAVGGTSFVFMNTAPEAGTPGMDGQLPAEIVPLFATRSGDGIPVTISDDALTVLLLDAPPGYVRFRASVSRRGGGETPVWSRVGLLPTYPDSLAVGMPGSLLATGEYTLALDGMIDESAGYEPIQSIAFDVTREPANVD